MPASPVRCCGQAQCSFRPYGSAGRYSGTLPHILWSYLAPDEGTLTFSQVPRRDDYSPFWFDEETFLGPTCFYREACVQVPQEAVWGSTFVP